MPLVKLTDVVDKSFEYIIVGGGTAGLVLGARLTEDPNTSVLVLEAGEENLDDPLILRAGYYGAHFGKPQYDWGFMTTPQKFSNQSQVMWARGKIVGGSSAINFLGWNMPTKEDIDAWEQLGNEGWNWDAFHKYSLRCSTFTPFPPTEEEARRTNYDGTTKKTVGTGPLQIIPPPYRLDVDISLEKTYHNLGIPTAYAPTDGYSDGFFLTPITMDPKTFTRSYAGSAYWTPNSSRPNFKLLTGAFVHCVILKEENGEYIATGVEFSHKSSADKVYIANASKEVELCAGALKTPHILELSGIGRPDVLKRIGIPVKIALDGVGENDQEHICCGVSFKLKDDIPDLTLDVLHDPEQARNHAELFEKGQGLHTLGISNTVFASLSNFSDKANEIYSKARREIEDNLAAGKYPLGIAEQYKIQLQKVEQNVPFCEIVAIPGLYSFPNPPVPGKKYFTLAAALLQPFSRGSIHATSADPKAQPEMDPHYFEHNVDLETLVEIMKFCRKTGQTSPLKKFFDETQPELNPGTSIQTDQQMQEHIKACISALFHTVGTASMLPREKDGVVDPRLRVYGTKNLRVADLSVVPLHVGSHTQCVAYVIGERAADIIKGIA